MITIAGPFIAVSAFLTSWIAFLGDTQATIAVTVSALVGVALYASAFVWLGLASHAGDRPRAALHRAVGRLLLGIRVGRSAAQHPPLRDRVHARLDARRFASRDRT